MKRIMLIASCLTVLTLSAADGPTARDHYLEARSSDPSWIGTRTSIQIKLDPSDKSGVREVGETSTFKSGDKFRIRVQTNTDGYVYLLARANDEGYNLLFPDKGSNGKANRFKAFEPRPIPGKGKTWLVFDNKPEIEGIYLFLSAKPLPEMERLKKEGGMISKADFDDLMRRNGSTTSMIYDEPSDEAGAIPATYYVERRNSGRLFLVRQIDLVHRAGHNRAAEDGR